MFLHSDYRFCFIQILKLFLSLLNFSFCPFPCCCCHASLPFDLWWWYRPYVLWTVRLRANLATHYHDGTWSLYRSIDSFNLSLTAQISNKLYQDLVNTLFLDDQNIVRYWPIICSQDIFKRRLIMSLRNIHNDNRNIMPLTFRREHDFMQDFVAFRKVLRASFLVAS